ncbi:MAG: hypothetical protein P1U57_02870, partial [Oleibacter sp.]|nr:hypothetical protein [Thalassolituus sp.]
MSYILEALKKSEQERQRRAPASTQMTDHSAPSVAISDVSAVASSNRLLIIILFVVSTLFGGLIIYGLMRTTIDSSSAIDAPAEQNSNASIPLTTHQLVTPQVSTLPPDSVLAKIPTLDFQGHLYSSYGSKSYV